MARRKAVRAASAIPDVCAPVSYTATVHSPASYRWRGKLIRNELERFAGICGRDLDAEMIAYFCPDAARLTGHSLDWLAEKTEAIRSGKGCAQSTLAALMPVIWRLPHIGWPICLPPPPRGVALAPTVVRQDGAWVRVLQRDDGSTFPFPPRAIPRPLKSKDAA